VSNDLNIATLVNSLNVLVQGHSQLQPWTSSEAIPKRSKVLIVDDEASVRAMIKTALEDVIDADLMLASGGNEALEHIQNHQFDLVILDMVMPDKDGFLVARELRKKGVPFIACTSLSDIKSLQRIADSGSFSLISKPASFPQIQGVITAALKYITHPRLLSVSSHCCEICTARGALSVYLSVSPDEAYDVIREMARDNHGNSRDMAIKINQYVDFMAKAKIKHMARMERKEKRGGKK